jgi:FkbM family methyltransferase
LVDLLRRTESLAHSEAASVTILPAAASDRVGIVTFNIANRARATNHLDGTGSAIAGGTREQQTVVSITLDWLLERTAAPDVVKIDVEGAEEMVLAGATGVLGQARPRILCEVRQDNVDAVTRQLEACGYEIYDAEVEQHRREPIARAVWNTLAVPK